LIFSSRLFDGTWTYKWPLVLLSCMLIRIVRVQYNGRLSTIFRQSDAADWWIQQWLAFVPINCFCCCNSLLLVFITSIIIVIIIVVLYLSLSMLFMKSSLRQSTDSMRNSTSLSTFYCPYSSLKFLILLYINFLQIDY